MTDTWTVTVKSTDDRDLGEFSSTRLDPPHYLDDAVDTVEINRAPYTETGVVDRFIIYKNGVLYANLNAHVKFRVTPLVYQEGQLIVSRNELIYTEVKQKICTCGCEKVYGKDSGLCVDWCDSRN
jgi:hypothetical protein